MASTLPQENPSVQKFHKAGESGARSNAGNFAEQSATVAWLEKSATKDPQFVEHLRKFAQHHPTLASASKLAPRLFFASIARALRDGLIWYESDPTQNQKGGGQAGGGGAGGAGGGGGGAASSSSSKAASSGTGDGKAGSKAPKTPSAAPSSLMFDPRAPEPEAEPLETPPSVPGRATDGMTH